MLKETELIGLRNKDIASRREKFGSNTLPQSDPKKLYRILIDVIKEPMFLMLLTAGTIYLILGDTAEALFMLSFVFSVIGMTLIQEHKTQRALESLRDLSVPRALVIREGQEVRISGHEVVHGDVMLLHEGDRIAADSIILEGQVSIDESLLSGESVPVTKTIGDPLFASTVVTKGFAITQVQAVGKSTMVGHIGESLKQSEENISGLQRSSRALIQMLSIIAIVIAGGLVLINWGLNGLPLLQSLLSGIALSMAILPEEIPVILTVFLALGAWRITKINVLTRRVSAVEALGAITILAVDKTGTLTQNRMQIAELMAEGESFIVDQENGLPETYHRLLEFAMLATPADPYDPMEKAIQSFGHERLGGTEHLHDQCSPEFLYDLSPEIMAMTRIYSDIDSSLHLLATKGSPEAIIDLCHLPETKRTEIQTFVEVMASRGLRILGVAKGELPSSQKDPIWPKTQHDFDFTFLGLIGFIDPLRPEIPNAIAQCRSAGIRILMLTGDHPATARAIARQSGLSESANVITGDEMECLSDNDLLERLKETAICARMQPEQKLYLVQLLQQNGHVVGMTGDGVNDAPALKAADVGIAMGERGTDVAREAAAIVLLNDSFASIVAAIRQGRTIYDNITKATRFVFAVHLPIILVTLVPALLHWPAMLQPVHIVLLQLLIDPACAVVFEAEAPSSTIMSRPPRHRNATPFTTRHIGFALAQGLGIALILIGGYTLFMNSGWEIGEIRLSLFMALVPTIFLLVVSNANFSGHSSETNPWIFYMFSGVGLLLLSIVYIPFFHTLLEFGSVNAYPIVASGCLFILSGLWLLFLHKISQR